MSDLNCVRVTDGDNVWQHDERSHGSSWRVIQPKHWTMFPTKEYPPGSLFYCICLNWAMGIWVFRVSFHNWCTCNQYLRYCCLFKAMMRVIDALSTCVRHVGTFEDAPELEAIRSLPTCILKILKETFQHCKVGVIQQWGLFEFSI